MSILVGKPVTTWAWTQWDTRPCLVVYRYQGEGKADGQRSGRRWDSFSSVRPEDRDTYINNQYSLLKNDTAQLYFIRES